MELMNFEDCLVHLIEKKIAPAVEAGPKGIHNALEELGLFSDYDEVFHYVEVRGFGAIGQAIKVDARGECHDDPERFMVELNTGAGMTMAKEEVVERLVNHAESFYRGGK